MSTLAWALSLARLLAGLRVVVEVGVVAEKSRSRVAVELVPPDAHQKLLREDGSVRAKEVEGLVQGADVEHLTAGFNVGVVAGELLLVAVERSFGNFRVDRVVDVGFSGDGRVVAFLAFVLLA